MGVRGPGKSVEVHTPADSHESVLNCTVRVKRWFADVATVKKMYTAVARSLSVQNEEEILSGYFESDLDYGNIVENSERVKVIERALGPDVVTFTDGSFQQLLHDDVVKGSVVVTNEGENREWIEGVDYEIDYGSGRIRHLLLRNTGGGNATGAGAGSGSDVVSAAISLTIEKSVNVHYQYYLTKTRNFDYSINYVKGTLSRKDGSTLQSGAKVYVDYRVQEVVSDEVVAQCIDQAHVWIVSRTGQDVEILPCGVDDNLKYGEAYFALYLIAKIGAANLIYEKRSDDIEEAAKELSIISEDYRRLSLSFLQPYLTFPPLKQSGRRVKNPYGTNN